MSDLLDQLRAVLQDRYEIERELGRGGMATVFLAHDRKHERQVAIKVMGHDAAQQMGAERFHREIRTAAQLSHPAILQLYDSGEIGGTLYYVMPFVQEGSLRDRLDRERQVSIVDAVAIARDVAEALHHAHQKNIIHRDIKPENILFQSGRVVLADFGIARALDPSGQQLTQTGMAVGTPAYMSPEQAAGDPNLDGRSDVYALGCVLYEMLAGHPPFMGGPREVIARHLADPVPPLRTARPSVPASVEAAVMRALAKVPADRFSSAHAFGQALSGDSGAAAASAGVRGLLRSMTLKVGLGYGAVTLLVWLATMALADQLALSPHLPRFVVAALLFLFPAALVIGHRLGRAAGRWRGSHTFGVAANVALASVALLLLFGGKDLGAATMAVTLTDEQGNTVERVIPKAEFRTRIAIFDFDTEAADSSTRWLAHGVPSALAMDLLQDLYIDLRVGVHFREELRARGFPNLTDVPLPLKREIAAQQFRDRFVAGQVARDNGGYVVRMGLYDTRSGRQLRDTTVHGPNPLHLVDELARTVKSTVNVPDAYASHIRDLPVAELLTSSLVAWEHLIRAEAAIIVRNDFATAVRYLETAVAEDPTFAIAQFMLGQSYAVTGRGGEALKPLQAAVDHAYRLPAKIQNQIKAEWFSLRNEQDKAYALHEMNAELYPHDVMVQAALAQTQILRGQRREAIATYEHIFEFDPGQHDFLRGTGQLYQSLGDHDRALKAFSRYSALNPDDGRAYIDMGDVHSAAGQFDEARAAYQRALLLDPGDVETAGRVAHVDLVTGGFDAALEGYQAALRTARTLKDSATALGGLAQYYRFRGQTRQALDYTRRQIAVTATYNVPVQQIINELRAIDDYVMAGDTTTAFGTLATLSRQLQPPFDRFASLGALELALALEDANQIDSAITQLESLIEQFSFEIFRPRAMYAQGRAHLLRGQPREAIAAWKQQETLEPSSSSVKRHLGEAYRALGELDRAESLLLEARKSSPASPLTNYELALVYQAKGKRAQAVASLQTALQTLAPADPHYVWAQRARQKLAELER